MPKANEMPAAGKRSRATRKATGSPFSDHEVREKSESSPCFDRESREKIVPSLSPTPNDSVLSPCSDGDHATCPAREHACGGIIFGRRAAGSALVNGFSLAVRFGQKYPDNGTTD